MTREPDAANTDATRFWDERYVSRRTEHGRMWSGSVNATVEQQVAELTPGTALELGSGEGADALWLAERGWIVTALDISSVALEVGAAEATKAGLSDRIEWVQTDLATWRPSAQYDLVLSAFLHSPSTSHGRPSSNMRSPRSRREAGCSSSGTAGFRHWPSTCTTLIPRRSRPPMRF